MEIAWGELRWRERDGSEAWSAGRGWSVKHGNSLGGGSEAGAPDEPGWTVKRGAPDVECEAWK